MPYPYYIRTITTISPYLYDIRTISVRYPKRTSAVRPYGVFTVFVRYLAAHPPYIIRLMGCTDPFPLMRPRNAADKIRQERSQIPREAQKNSATSPEKFRNFRSKILQLPQQISLARYPHIRSGNIVPYVSPLATTEIVN